MNKKASLLIFMSTLAATAACFSIVTATVSWFRTFENKDIDGSGSTFNSYFAGGDGSQADPYQIANSTQMYNFAWLQYMGVFNKDDNGDGAVDKQYYFVLNNDINMTGMVIPPIGTLVNPFVGHFEGNGYTVSNLKVSNTITTNQSDTNNIYYHPDGVEDLTGTNEISLYGKVEITGFFGVVGTPATSMISNHLSYDTDVMRVQNFYLDKVTINSTSQYALSGIIAGFVGAPNATGSNTEKVTVMENIGVYQSALKFASNSRGVNNSYDKTVSKYGLIGDYTTNSIEWKEVSGQVDDFGGTLDFKTLNRRLDYMMGSTSTTVSAPLFSNSNFNSYLYDYSIYNQQTGDTVFYWNTTPSKNSSFTLTYLTDGTYIPLNVNLTEMGLDNANEITSSITYSSRSYNRHSNTQYNTKTSEVTLSTNTGYIVGDGTKSSGKVVSRISNIGSLYKSLNLAGSGVASVSSDSYIQSNLQMLTTIDGSTWNRIEDSDNASASTHSDLSSYTKKTASTLNLTRYNDVKSSFVTMLNSSKATHGLGFKKPSTSFTFTYQTVSNVIINDGNGSSTKSTYQFVKNGINFTLKKSGFLTAVVGSYFNNYDSVDSTTNPRKNSAFRLYKVTRNDGMISGTPLEIQGIYYNRNTKDSQISSSSPGSGYSQVYGLDWFTNLPKGDTVYYIEIPLPSGDYFITNPYINGLQNAYIMYLDIGASGSSSQQAQDFDIKNVKYVAEKDRLDDYSRILFELTFANYTHNEDYIYFKHTGLSATPQNIYVYTTIVLYTADTTRVDVTLNASAQTWNNSL